MNGDDSTKTRNTPKIEISVRNFGPIAEADLDLRPLTVFVGPSNTGKTYLSVLIYALHGVFGGFSEFPLIHDVTTALKPQVNPTTLIEEIWDFLDKPNTEERGFKFSNLPRECAILHNLVSRTQIASVQNLNAVSISIPLQN